MKVNKKNIDHIRDAWVFLGEAHSPVQILPNLIILAHLLVFQVSSSHIFGSVLLQSPSLGDIDQRETFCVYLFPGNQQSRKVGLVLDHLIGVCLNFDFLLL